MDIQFIGSGDSAKAMIYYITDYITKSQLKSYVAYAALQMAVKKWEGIDSADNDPTIRSKRLLQKCAYALVSHQEMSAQQVVSYLMDYEDHFTSHRFGCLYWALFERFIEQQDSEKLYPVVQDQGSGVEGVDDDLNGNTNVEEVESEENATVGECEHSTEQSDQSRLTDGDEEEISMSIDSRGNVTALADQVCDYTLRPHQVKDLCSWDFIVRTEKIFKRRGKAPDIVEFDVSGGEPSDEGDAEDDGSEQENIDVRV